MSFYVTWHLHRRLGWVAVLLALAGCTRTHYRLRSDADAYGLIAEKASCAPWQPPSDFTIYPDPRSRFYDPTAPDDPLLPVPAPQLYAYNLPELPAREPTRFRPQSTVVELLEPNDRSASVASAEPVASSPNEPPTSPIRPVSFQQEARTPLSAEDLHTLLGIVTTGVYPEQMDGELTIAAIPQNAWEALPESCRRRMFEFESIREEYRRSFQEPVPESQRDHSPRLGLEDIVDLALINSREYQTAKENLYEAALALSLDRYDYALKFSGGNFANSSAADFTHSRTGGETTNTLRVPSLLTSDRLMATGGGMLSTLANDVVLTFNGPDGFAADVGSNLIFEIVQPVLQRDIVLENLTQSERNLVYAARSYARFRRTFFAALADRYYGLLLTYRGIEIDSQDLFSNLRGFLQGEAEYRAGRLPRFQVDQFEQVALRSRGRLINRCNGLEDSLDALKIAVGLPPEQPINLELTELDELTLRDQLSTAVERVRRAQRNLRVERMQKNPDRSLLLNSAIDLLRRTQALYDVREQAGYDSSDAEQLREPLLKLLVDESRVDVAFNRDALASILNSALPLSQFGRTMDIVDALLIQSARELEYLDRLGADSTTLQDLLQDGLALRGMHEELRAELKQTVETRDVDQIPVLVQSAVALLTEAENFAVRLDSLLPPRELDPARQLTITLREVDAFLQQSEQILADQPLSLVPVEIDMDDAMLTALTQRFDLMNTREELADSWRKIKLTGDELKSILNLRANQQIRTRADVNRPFDFTFDESTTRAVLRFDAPLNRRSQRNSFRRALIDYNQGLRSLLAAEDGIKAGIRLELRDLQLAREVYENNVAAAALAYERVISTRIQLQLGLEDVTARDVVESQGEYTASLLAVAGNHVAYIQDRIQLFLDLEQLVVDEAGFWPELYEDERQPTPHFQLPGAALPVYGTLPSRTKHSHKIKRMLDVPPGTPVIYETESPTASVPTEPELVPRGTMEPEEATVE